MSAFLLARWNGLSLFWRIQIAGWGLFAIADVVAQRVAFHSYTIAFARTALFLVCLVAISTAMRGIYLSRPFANRVSVVGVALIGLLSLLGAFIIASTVVLVHEALPWIVPPGRRGVEEFFVPFVHYFFALVGWSLAYFWLRAELAKQAQRRRTMRAQAAALRAELEQLRLQLDPHFLFNALNGVAEEIPEHPAAALDMLRNLTAYLRHSLDGINHTVVTVEGEVAGLAAYLAVQKARFGDRLHTRLDVTPEAAQRRIASFLLQPLVENAVKHGRRDDGLDLRVDIRLSGDTLHVEVENTGTLDATRPSARRQRPGIGLENVRRRLALHYPDRHAFSLAEIGERAGDKKVTATLELRGEPCGS
ncbi:histidine kinase [Reyranella sp.]|uniref:sensor histidine kinase n=1 Tax=Reyranella sp. TaxID=1929291 RepID=UPI0025FDB964|nr:histidine kinase [Reyranella sp.]